MPMFTHRSGGSPEELARGFWLERVIGTSSVWDRRRAWSSVERQRHTCVHYAVICGTEQINKCVHVSEQLSKEDLRTRGRTWSLRSSVGLLGGSVPGNHVALAQALVSQYLPRWTGYSSVHAGQWRGHPHARPHHRHLCATQRRHNAGGHARGPEGAGHQSRGASQVPG